MPPVIEDKKDVLYLDGIYLSDYGVSYQRICSVVAANNQTNPSGYVTQEKLTRSKSVV